MSKKTLNTATLEHIQDIYGQKNASLNTSFSIKELVESLSKAEIVLAERTLRRWLSQWEDQGLIKKTGQKRGTRYQFLASKQATKIGAQLPVFLHGIEPAKRSVLLGQLRDLWTHHSTALEGNTLSLGDTNSILELGLTISGKPLREHHEVVGHSKAIDLIYQICTEPLTKQHIFDLHTAVQLEMIIDIYAPIGQWKVENNFANSITSKGEPVIIQYADHKDVDALMTNFIQTINDWDKQNIDIAIDINNAHETYAKLHLAFVHIHPFADGNGRLARLIANIPLLKSGLPPLLIKQDTRREYITLLADYQTNVEIPNLDSIANNGFWPEPASEKEPLEPFTNFCADSYQSIVKLIDQNI